MNFNRKFLWVLFFGSMIGLIETLIGSINLPYRSVVLSTITLTLLSLSRYYLPKKGTSLFIIIIAVMFRINCVGIQTCTTNVFLCGPTALLLLGIGYEVFASIFISSNAYRFFNYLLTCAITSLVVFSIYAVLQTNILKSWDTTRQIDYIFVRGSLTAIFSGTFTVLVLYIARHFGQFGFAKINPYFRSGILISVIIASWVVGSYITF